MTRKSENQFANEKYLQEGKRALTSWAKRDQLSLGRQWFTNAPEWVTKETKEALIRHSLTLNG